MNWGYLLASLFALRILNRNNEDGSGLRNVLGWLPADVRTKPGVDASRLTPEAREIVRVAREVYRDLGGLPMVITSTYDGEHMTGSRHYSNNAVDLRIWTLAEVNRPVAARIIGDRLGPDYDVILEATHIHGEYDPD